MNNAAIKIDNELSPMTKKEFEQKLRDIGKERYHDNCRFHHLLHSGMLNKGQVQAWALNRYYYQINISIKDSALMSRIKDPELRRVWVKRILDHDGRKDDEGGIERWYKLTDGLDLNREYVKSTQGILPATRFAVDAYVTFVREKSLLEGVTSSLTELFAPKIHKERIVGMLENYDFINSTSIPDLNQSQAVPTRNMYEQSSSLNQTTFAPRSMPNTQPNSRSVHMPMSKSPTIIHITN